MFQDLQELFYIGMAPFFYYIFLPVLIAGGVLLAIARAVIEIFRPPRG